MRLRRLPTAWLGGAFPGPCPLPQPPRKCLWDLDILWTGCSLGGGQEDWDWRGELVRVPEIPRDPGIKVSMDSAGKMRVWGQAGS